MKTTTDLCTIARSGGSLVINAATKTTTDLCTIARNLKGGTLTLTEVPRKTTTDLCTIARANPGKVIFDLT